MINLYQLAIPEVDENEMSTTRNTPSILTRIRLKIESEKASKQQILQQKNKITTNRMKNFNEFLERNSNHLKSKTQKILKLKENILEKEQVENTFKPKLNKYSKSKQIENKCEIIYKGKKHLIAL